MAFEICPNLTLVSAGFRLLPPFTVITLHFDPPFLPGITFLNVDDDGILFVEKNTNRSQQHSADNVFFMSRLIQAKSFNEINRITDQIEPF